RKDWKERFRVDENGANRLGKAVMRAGASLPYLIMAGLAPREDAAWIVGAVAVTGGVLGLRALVRGRTWGLFALAGAGAAAVTLAPVPVVADISVFPWLGALLCAAAVAPFVPAMARALRSH